MCKNKQIQYLKKEEGEACRGSVCCNFLSFANAMYIPAAGVVVALDYITASES